MADEVRRCISCEQNDDGPRDQVVINIQGDVVYWHLDCHAKVTGCETCKATISVAKGKKDEELREFIVMGGASAAINKNTRFEDITLGTKKRGAK